METCGAEDVDYCWAEEVMVEWYMRGHVGVVKTAAVVRIEACLCYRSCILLFARAVIICCDDFSCEVLANVKQPWKI